MGLTTIGLPFLQGANPMSESMNKSQLLDRIRRARADWEAVLAERDEAQLTQSKVESDWTLKDLIAHITWYDREMVELVQAQALVGSELWGLPGSQRNAAIRQANRDRPLPEVRDEARQVFEALLAGLESLAEEDLHDPGRFPNMPPDWVPWRVIAENTYEHYADHLAQVRAWLKTQTS
jgi:hypothetical protein